MEINMKPITLVLFCLTASVFGCQNTNIESARETEAVKKELISKTKKIVITPEPTKPPASKSVNEVVKKTPSFPAAMKPGETLKFGAPFALDGKAITLSMAIAKGESKKSTKISGNISTVCKAKGCWFTLKHDKSPEVRVKMKDYGFFFPKNADGGKATVEGILSKRIVPKKEAQHYADDAVKAGEKPKVVKGDEEVFELIVSSVEITKPS